MAEREGFEPSPLIDNTELIDSALLQMLQMHKMLYIITPDYTQGDFGAIFNFGPTPRFREPASRAAARSSRSDSRWLRIAGFVAASHLNARPNPPAVNPAAMRACINAFGSPSRESSSRILGPPPAFNVSYSRSSASRSCNWFFNVFLRLPQLWMNVLRPAELPKAGRLNVTI